MFIEFYQLNAKLLVLIIFPIFSLLEDISNKEYIVKNNQLFISFRYFLSYILAGIFLIIFKIRNRMSSPKTRLNSFDEKKEEDVIDKVFNQKLKKRKLISFLLIVILCCIGIFCQLYRKLFIKPEFEIGNQSIELLFDILTLIALSYFILHQKLYEHHFVSSGIMVAILLILFILSIPYMDLIFGALAYYIFYSILFSLYDVLKKKFMNILFYTPYFIMLMIGTINTTLLLIFDIIAYNTNPDISGVIIGFKDNINSVEDIFWLILGLILECIWNLGFWLTIYYFTPCHVFISEFIYQFGFYIYDATQEKDEFYSTANVIVFSIG